MDKSDSDWMPLTELAARQHYQPSTLYEHHKRRVGPFVSILVKHGGRIGCWRADYEALIARQRRLPEPVVPATHQSATA